MLTDIIGDEDHYGDMDFKIAGTQNGITGIQLDLKIDGISEEIIRGTLTQAREARIEILRKMLTAISRPRSEISALAPRLLRTKIDPEKIGALIGPGGKTIRGIQESTGAVIEVEDDGTVTVASSDMQGAEARDGPHRSPHGQRCRSARSTRAASPASRISARSSRSCRAATACATSASCPRTTSKNVNDVCKVGDFLEVKVIAIDDQDRIKLSRKAALREMAEAGDTA